MSNVIAINGNGERLPAPFEADPNVVEAIEALLQQAKDGLIQGIAYAACKNGRDEAATGMAGMSSVVLIGAITVLQARLVEAIRE